MEEVGGKLLEVEFQRLGDSLTVGGRERDKGTVSHGLLALSVG